MQYLENGSSITAYSLGELGVAWIGGWEMGRAITKTQTYQRLRAGYFIHLLTKEYGIPSESNHKI